MIDIEQLDQELNLSAVLIETQMYLRELDNDYARSLLSRVTQAHDDYIKTFQGEKE